MVSTSQGFVHRDRHGAIDKHSRLTDRRVRAAYAAISVSKKGTTTAVSSFPSLRSDPDEYSIQMITILPPRVYVLVG
jgi:hypothetical protein